MYVWLEVVKLEIFSHRSISCIIDTASVEETQGVEKAILKS